MKHDELRGKISETPLKWRPHLRRDILATPLVICYMKVRRNCISGTHARFSSFSGAEAFIVWPFPRVSVEHYIPQQPQVKHLGLQLQPQHHGLFLQHQDGLAC